MANQGGGGRRGGYRGFPRKSHPPPPTYGRGRGRDGNQRDRGGFSPSPAEPLSTEPSQRVRGGFPPPPGPLLTESSLNRETERLSLSESAIVPTPVARGSFPPPPAARYKMALLTEPSFNQDTKLLSQKPVVVTPGSSSATVPAPPAATESSLNRETEILSQKSVVVTPGSSSAIVPTPVDVPEILLKFPTRPGFGIVGRKCVVQTNHFLVDFTIEKDVCNYNVVIVPATQSSKLNRLVLSELVKIFQHSDLGGRTPVYDGSQKLYTAGQLPFSSKSFPIKLLAIDGSANGRAREFTVTIKFVAKVDLDELQQFLQGRLSYCPSGKIQALNVVLKESLYTKYTTFGNSSFSPEFSINEDCSLKAGVEYWRGFYKSLQPTQMGLSLNMDITTTTFYKGVHLMTFVAEYLDIRHFSRPLHEHDRIKLNGVLRGVRVKTTHNPDLQIQYKISGISSEPIDEITFPDKNGKSLSVVQYFWERYGHKIKHTKLPCLLASSLGRPTYLPMEVCEIIPGQRYAKNLNGRQVLDILRDTCQRPAKHKATILKIVKENNYGSDNFVKEFGMKIDEQMVSVDARILPTPRLKYHDASGVEKSCRPLYGRWNMENMKVVNGGTVKNWTCLNFSQKSEREVTKFCDDLVATCNRIGMVFNPRPCINPISADSTKLEAALRNLHQLASSKVPDRELYLVIVILPEIDGSYGMIKKVFETELGVISQCCAPQNVSRHDPKYLTNVCLKINVKVGGRNTVLEAAVSKGIPYLTDMRTIIFGADVTHPPAQGDGSFPSIAAVVASMDWPEVTKYRAVVSAQKGNVEIIQDMFTMTKELLIAFYRSNNTRKPHRIIFYRDGVSHGMFSEVLLTEMLQIRQACASLEEDYLPPVTFVVVQKRHHTRFFPMNKYRASLSGNILPGTVIDTKICHPAEFDFYLCSHSSLLGTSHPVRYHVLYDENAFTADGLQSLTNNLCYTFARCTKSLSIVPPAFYAHLAAARARYYLEGDPSKMLPEIHENVKNWMFYC